MMMNSAKPKIINFVTNFVVKGSLFSAKESFQIVILHIYYGESNKDVI